MFEKQKRCSKCGLTFECGGLFGCWCRQVKLDQAALAALKQQYDDCLCPSCLRQISQDSSASGRESL
jgi:hypothetical protein